MAGIYIHIPFCKKACHYCDFHFSTQSGYVGTMVQTIAKELGLQKDYLKGESINTIYFGGGTPSLLHEDHINLLLSEMYRYYDIRNNAEITFEANPDDLDHKKMAVIRGCGINRLSIGVQSFDDQQLLLMNRAHNSKEAFQSIDMARSSGIDNITIDLIYGLPGSTLGSWRNDLEQAIHLKVPHISAYCLTIEPDTVFGRQYKKKQLILPDESIVAHQFEMLVEMLTKSGFEHYEVSNFCLPGMYSQHNSNYWKFQKYLGVGPSAHSFDLNSRQANVKNNQVYVASINKGIIPFQVETLTNKDKANEYLLTSLRTQWGCDLHFLKDQFGIDLLATHRQTLDNYRDRKLMVENDGVIFLTTQGKLLADHIIGDFFIL